MRPKLSTLVTGVAVMAIVQHVVLSIHVAGAAAVKEEDGVLVLNFENFDGVITDNIFVLVEFWGKSCGYCKKFAPEYAKAAKALADEGSEVKLGKVDADLDAEWQLAGTYGVHELPTLIFFKNGKPVENYPFRTGGRKAAHILDWLKKKAVLTPAERCLQKCVTDKGKVATIQGVTDKPNCATDSTLQAKLKAINECVEMNCKKHRHGANHFHCKPKSANSGATLLTVDRMLIILLPVLIYFRLILFNVA